MKQVSMWLATLLFATGVSAQVIDPAKDRQNAERFGAALAKAYNARDEKALTALIDLRGFSARVAGTMNFNARDQEEFFRGMQQAGLPRILAANFVKLDDTKGTVRFMRATDSRPARALVRFDFGGNGFDYTEYVIETNSTGNTRAVDWFTLSAGQLVSETLGGIGQLFAGNASAVERLFGIKRADARVVAQLRTIGDLQRTGKYAEALAELRRLPTPMAESRIILSQQVSMASLADLDEEYVRILSKLAEKYSDDPAANFLLIDHYFTLKNRPKMLVSLDTMEKRVGVDGVTRQLRAAAYFVTDDYPNMLKFAEESVRLEPDRLDAHDVRANALVHVGKFPEAVAAYREMEKRFDLQFTRAVFDGEPDFAGFVASPAFRTWLPK